MAMLYIRKIETALSRQLTQSERKLAAQMLANRVHVNYAIEYFR